MAIPRYHTARAALSAPLHAQITVERIDGFADGPLPLAHVEGRVLRVFRGHIVAPGDAVRFDVQCISPGGVPPPGGVHWPLERLRSGATIEAYFEPLPSGDFKVAGHGEAMAIFAEASVAPRLVFAEEDARKPSAAPVRHPATPVGERKSKFRAPLAILVAVVLLLAGLVYALLGPRAHSK
jgi:hypothetical protein